MDRRTASWPRLLEALVVIPAVVILAVTAKGWTGRSPLPNLQEEEWMDQRQIPTFVD